MSKRGDELDVGDSVVLRAWGETKTLRITASWRMSERVEGFDDLGFKYWEFDDGTTLAVAAHDLFETP